MAALIRSTARRLTCYPLSAAKANKTCAIVCRALVCVDSYLSQTNTRGRV